MQGAMHRKWRYHWDLGTLTNKRIQAIRGHEFFTFLSARALSLSLDYRRMYFKLNCSRRGGESTNALG